MIWKLSRQIKHAKTTAGFGLSLAKLKKDSLHGHVYAESSFASNDVLGSQLGYIILLCHRTSDCHVLDFARKKAKGILRSVMAWEVCAFIDAFAVGFIVSMDSCSLLGREISISVLTDSNQLIDAMREVGAPRKSA